MVTNTIIQVFLFVSGLTVSVAATVLFTILVKRMALRWNLVDKPNHRSVHKKPNPRIGGIGCFRIPF